MRRALVLALAVACSSSPKPAAVPAPAPMPAPAHPVHGPAPAPAPAPLPPPAHPFRTSASDYHVNPALAGTGKTYMVASEEDYATKVGLAVLASGGNAADAAVATSFALAVTLPRAGNLGGGGFAMVRAGKHKVMALDFRETAPAGASRDMYKDEPKGSLVGYKAPGIPGTVAGLEALHAKYGKKRWKDLVAPAIALARDGFRANQLLHDSVEQVHAKYPMQGDLAAIYVPDGHVVAAGTIIKNEKLAKVLERIAAKGGAGFYKGDTGKAIAGEMKSHGGLITEADLAGYKSIWREPIQVDYRGKHIYTTPLPSSGGIVIAMTANMLRGVELAKLGWHSTAHIHWLGEVWRRAYAARNLALGDPAFIKDMPLARLQSQKEADRLVATITDRATPSKDVPALVEGTHTTNLCVVDKDGMAVALTTTLNTSYGSGVMIEGVIMNNEMDDFAAHPGEPNVYGLVQGPANEIQPGKRMLSSTSPTVIEDDRGELYMVVGAEGGPRIISSVWQTLSNVIDFGMPVDAAVAAPRIHHQHLPDDIVVDDDALSADVDAELTKLGYTLVWGKPTRIFASVNAIVRTPSGWAGAVDPRDGGAAKGDN